MEENSCEPNKVQSYHPPGFESGNEQQIRIFGFVSEEVLKLHLGPEMTQMEQKQAKDDNTEHEHIAGAPAVGSRLAAHLIALDTSAGLHILPCEPAAVGDVHQETEGEHGDHDIDDGKCHEIATFLEQTVGSTELACECVDYREKVDGSVQKQEDDEESSAD
jgi:hypothetical protein